MHVDRESRRLAWCVALLLRHAPDAVVCDLLARLDAATRRFLCRDEYLPASVVTLLLRDGTEEDRRTIARNPQVLGRPLPGLPGPARYAARRGPSPELLGTLRAELGHPLEAPLTSEELIALLRLHGSHRPRVPLDVLALPHGLDPEVLLREHARDPLPPGSVEALLMVAGLDRRARLALLDTRAQTSYGPCWYRPAVRAVRTGTLTFDELVAAVAPAHRTLLLGQVHAVRSLGWNLAEWTAMRSALMRVLRPELGEDPGSWAALRKHARAFTGTLPELAALAAAEAADPGPPPPPVAAPAVRGLTRAVDALAPGALRWPGGSVERELALASLSVPNAMGDVNEDIRWVRGCLDRGVLTGTDVILHKAPAAWALDEDHWLGVTDYPDRHDRHQAVLDARTEADRLFAAALAADADAWWRAARALPDFGGTLPELLAAVIQGDSVSNRP